MTGKRGLLGKKGAAKPLGWTLALLLLDIIFFVIIGIAVVRESKNVSLLEDMYAKQIALLIDNSRPGTIVYLGMKEGADVALKSNTFPQVSADGSVVTVKLNSREGGGQNSRFYSDVKVSFDYIGGDKNLKISIEKK